MSSNLTKRKRRRTRKCLDEIRKRSRRLIFSDNDNEKNTENQNVTNNIIKETNGSHKSRLTLAMFPKAIQSETITRPILAEMSKRMTIHLDDIVGKKNNTTTDNFTMTNTANALSMNNTNENDKDQSDQTIDLCEQNFENVINSTDTSGSYVLISPNNSPNSITDTDNIQEPPNHLQNLCEDFLSDASSYMKANASEALLKDYNLEKVRQKLRELYIKHKVFEEKMETVNQRKSVQIDEPILQNPIDYIRQKCTKLQDHSSYYGQNFSESSSSSQGSPQSPPTNLISPKCMQYETPEYIYFPHKLN